jgi:SAM dependent carboxyl methyltransferase
MIESSFTSKREGRRDVKRRRTTSRRHGRQRLIQQACKAAGGRCCFGYAVFGKGSSKPGARPGRTTHRHRRLWIIAREKLDGPYAGCDRGLRRRFGPNRAVSVFHIDQPSNDFTTLFAVLDSDPDTYVLDEPHVFPAVIGRSFYENVLPPGTVHLGWSSYAAVWLSRIPTLIPGHFFSALSTGRVRAEFDRQGRTEKPFSRCVQESCAPEDGWSSCFLDSPMTDRRGSNICSTKPTLHWKKWSLMARSRPTNAREWYWELILGGNAISSLPLQPTENSRG